MSLQFGHSNHMYAFSNCCEILGKNSPLSGVEPASGVGMLSVPTNLAEVPTVHLLPTHDEMAVALRIWHMSQDDFEASDELWAWVQSERGNAAFVALALNNPPRPEWLG